MHLEKHNDLQGPALSVESDKEERCDFESLGNWNVPQEF